VEPVVIDASELVVQADATAAIAATAPAASSFRNLII